MSIIWVGDCCVVDFWIGGSDTHTQLTHTHSYIRTLACVYVRVAAHSNA